MRRAAPFLLILILSAATFGQFESSPENWCREGSFTREFKDFWIAAVQGSRNSRVFFQNDEKAESPRSAECRSTAYLVPGDKVIVNRSRNGFACAWYSPAKGRPTVGWISSGSLRRVDNPVVAGYSEWLGEWRSGENSISFTENKLAGFLNVTGNAYWKGVGDNVHVGKIDGRYEPRNGVIEYSEGDGQYDCRATLRLLGGFLIVSDNLNCGGVNVSFSGIYRKHRK